MTKSPGSRGLRQFFLAAAALLLVCQPAWAEKRVALVLGNAAYQNVAKLPNPVNDGAVIAATLRNAGFDVVDSRQDLPAAETRRTLRDFADRARDADIAVVYYAGHGIEVDGANYLIPVDAKLERDTDVYDEALSLDRVLLAIEPAKKLRLVILDACRDNPFSKNMKRTLATRAIGQGLAKVEPNSPNMLIAYSAKAGSTAADGDGKNSPFTVALSKHLTTPGLDVRRAFGFVRDDVLKTTSNRQEPFVYGSLGGEDVPLVPAPVKAAPTAPASSPQAEARRDYELALQIGNKDALNAFLAQYPEGFYASLAKIQLTKFAAEETRVAATEKARLAEQERARLAAEGAQKTTAGQGGSRRQSGRAGPHCGRKGQAGCPGSGDGRRTEAGRSGKGRPRHQDCRGCAGGQIGDAGSRRAQRRRAADRGQQIAAGRTPPRRLPQCGGRRQLEHHVAALAHAVQPLCQDQVRHQARLDRRARHDQAEDRRGSVRWSASTATRPMATVAPGSPAPPARSSMTTMSARSGARSSRLPSATDRNQGRRRKPGKFRRHHKLLPGVSRHGLEQGQGRDPEASR